MRKQQNMAGSRLRPLSGMAAVLFVIGIVLTEEACSEADLAGPVIDPPTEIDTPATAARTDHAPEVFASVTTGTLGGIDARFDQISKIVPEFAGYYIDDDGDVVTALTDLTKAVAVDSLTRGEVDAKLLASGGQREYKQVTYSFSQLLVWRDLIAGELMIRGDVAFMDIDQARNQLYIGLISPAADAGVRALAARADIPAAAIFLESVGRPRPDALRAPNVMADNINTGRFATSLGGIRVRIDGDPDWLCTLWLGVKRGGNSDT
ncbi:hypothetical protein [Candidatus Palauibacter sp.]|uniref:hypothetical protein n=1 Tax=Candidatus Palauibacter sp. TaxID=3101350 RepID=UPI003C6FC89A